MSQNVSLTIGNYTVNPVPSQISISIDMIRTGAGHKLNSVYTATMNGILNHDSCSTIDVADILHKQALMRNEIGDCGDCRYMLLSCENVILFRGHVRIVSLEFQPSPDNWVLTSPYTLVVEWDAASDLSPRVTVDISGNIVVDEEQTADLSGCYACLRSVDESWDISPIDGYNFYNIGVDCSGNAEAYQITHSLSAQGVDCCDVSGNVTPGWQAARTWVLDHIQCTPTIAYSGGVFGGGSLEYFNLKRSQTYNIANGEFSVNETWTGLTPGTPRCTEEFTVDCSENDSQNLTTYSIAGTITGFESRHCEASGYGVIATTAIESAKECWTQVQPVLINRINCLASPSGCSINVNPISKNITFNPLAGTVNYNYTYTDRLQFITNAKTESIVISEVLPSEQIVLTNVLGRVAPLIERPGIINTLTKSVSISATFNKLNCNAVNAITPACSGFIFAATPDETYVNSLLCCIENDLENIYDNVIITQNQSSFNPINGVYSRNVTWTLQNCSQSLPDLCGS